MLLTAELLATSTWDGFELEATDNSTSCKSTSVVRGTATGQDGAFAYCDSCNLTPLLISAKAAPNCCVGSCSKAGKESGTSCLAHIIHPFHCWLWVQTCNEINIVLTGKLTAAKSRWAVMSCGIIMWKKQAGASIGLKQLLHWLTQSITGDLISEQYQIVRPSHKYCMAHATCQVCDWYQTTYVQHNTSMDLLYL